jgi:predicted short-subunit dehydrogenase-like oxidoreductase (DUF2520 family)
MLAEPLLIVGAGRAGVTLAVALLRAGQPVRLVARRSERRDKVQAWLQRHSLAIDVLAAPLPAAVVILAVPDRALAAAAHALVAANAVAPGAIWLHLSGAAPAQVLQVPGGATELGAMHPLAALPDPLDLEDAAAAVRPVFGATFALAGTHRAQEMAASLVAHMAGHIVAVADAARPLYHAAAALAANDLVALLSVAERAAIAGGLTPEQARTGLGHLMQTALDAVRRLPNATPLRLGLTGAVARGDAATLARHMQALAGHDPASALIHMELSSELVELMREGGLGPAALTALDSVLAQVHRPDEDSEPAR